MIEALNLHHQPRQHESARNQIRIILSTYYSHRSLTTKKSQEKLIAKKFSGGFVRLFMFARVSRALFEELITLFFLGPHGVKFYGLFCVVDSRKKPKKTLFTHVLFYRTHNRAMFWYMYTTQGKFIVLGFWWIWLWQSLRKAKLNEFPSHLSTFNNIINLPPAMFHRFSRLSRSKDFCLQFPYNNELE